MNPLLPRPRLAGRRCAPSAGNKMRAALTMLGVFIGVAALIAMVAVGEGARAAVKEQLGIASAPIC